MMNLIKDLHIFAEPRVSLAKFLGKRKGSMASVRGHFVACFAAGSSAKDNGEAVLFGKNDFGQAKAPELEPGWKSDIALHVTYGRSPG